MKDKAGLAALMAVVFVIGFGAGFAVDRMINPPTMSPDELREYRKVIDETVDKMPEQKETNL